MRALATALPRGVTCHAHDHTAFLELLVNGGGILILIGSWILAQTLRGNALERLGVLPTPPPPAPAPDPTKVLPGSGIDPKKLLPLPLRSGGGGVG